jgi:hypothetical protein
MRHAPAIAQNFEPPPQAGYDTFSAPVAEAAEQAKEMNLTLDSIM